VTVSSQPAPGQRAGVPAGARLRCTWSTSAGRPFFANLKVMRAVLGALRGELAAVRGGLPAYVFVEDRLVFLAEGPPVELEAALERARTRSEAAFADSDRKELWGEARQEDVSGLDREALLLPLRRLPVERGLAEDLSEYPWAGGDWLVQGP